MTARGLREQKREATGQAMARAAYDLALERGLDGFGTDDVVQRAGFARRTFANHYSCKEEAVVSVVLAGVDDASAALGELPDQVTLLDALQAVMREQFTTDTLATMRELMALARRHPALRPYVLEVQDRMRRSAQELLREVAGDRYPGLYVPLLLGSVYGAAMAALEGQVEVQLGSDDEAPGAMDYQGFLDLTFGYLRNGF
jgi:AcrR family transcriptional regulator